MRMGTTSALCVLVYQYLAQYLAQHKCSINSPRMKEQRGGGLRGVGKNMGFGVRKTLF